MKSNLTMYLDGEPLRGGGPGWRWDVECKINELWVMTI
jgi:hypothetical protein